MAKWDSQMNKLDVEANSKVLGVNLETGEPGYHEAGELRDFASAPAIAAAAEAEGYAASTATSEQNAATSEANALESAGSAAVSEGIATGKASEAAEYRTEARQALTDTLAAKAIVEANSEYLGGIAHDAVAPTPAKNGKYEFISAGIKPAWLDAPIDVTNVAVGDIVIVTYTAPSTYTRTWRSNPEIVQTTGTGTGVSMSQKAVTDITEKLITESAVTDNKLTPISSLDGKYINIYDAISDDTNYRIDIYEVEALKALNVLGKSAGLVLICAYYSDINLDNPIKYELVASTGDIVDIDLNTVTPEGANYFAVSVHKMYGGIVVKSTTENIAENVSGIKNDMLVPSEFSELTNTIVGKLVNPWGALVDSAYYSINIFDISGKKKIRLKGQTWGYVTIYSFSNSETLDTLLPVEANMTPEIIEVDKIISNNGDFKYLAISQHLDYTPISVICEGDSISELIENVVIPQKNVFTVGDSLTGMNGWQPTLRKKIGAKYTVYNFGVGGENTLEIMARHGGSNMYLKNSVSLPSDTSLVQIGTLADSGLLSAWNGFNVNPLRQATEGLNPVNVDGIECTLSYTDNNYYLNRITAGAARMLYSGTPVYSAMQKVKPDVEIMYMGTNGFFGTDAELVSMYKSMIAFSKTKNHIIVGLHQAPYHDTEGLEALEALMQKEFGNKYINLRKYLTGNALSDAGITPSENDISAISNGNCPPSLLADSVHFNASGWLVVGNKIYETGNNLGYW